MGMALYGTFRKNKKIWDSAQWYGKVSTTIVFVILIVLVLFPHFPSAVVNVLIIIAALGLTGSLLMYIRMFWQLNSKRYAEKAPEKELQK